MTPAPSPFRLPLVAILRGLPPGQAPAHFAALLEEGYDAIEVPLNSPDWATSIGGAVRAHGKRAWIGGGTVLRRQEVDILHGLGARFIVTPNTNPDLIRHAAAGGLQVLAGFATASEAFAALEAGASMLKLWIGLGVATLLGLIIFGGIKRIAAFAELVVPFMALAFILMAIVVMILNAHKVPGMFADIFSSAFGAHAAFGAIIGQAIAWGVKRGVYANEAGQGTGPHAAAAAEVSHPAKQGYVQAFAIYFDTMLVCTSTAFLLLSTGMYNTFRVVMEDGKETLQAIVSGVPGVAPSEGAQFTQAAVESVLPGWGSAFVALALFFFAFTTIMAYYYMAETNLTYLAGVRKTHPLATLLLRLGIIAMVVFGAYHNAATAWTLGDIGVGLMAWLNIIAILILQKPALLALQDYERQKKLGVEPVFDPEALGIRNAGFWSRKD